MISEDKNDTLSDGSISRYNIIESLTNKIVIRIVGRNGEPYKDLFADYCRYATSPKSGRRYLIAGSNIEQQQSKETHLYNPSMWLLSLRDFYKLKPSQYYGQTSQAVVARFDKIMTIKAENVISITKPDQVAQ